MSQTTPPLPAAAHKLRVLKTAVGAYRTVAARFGSVIKAAAVPYILSVVVTGIAVLAVQNVALGGAIIFLILGPYTLAGVAWYRLTLLGPVAGAPSLLPRWTRRHWRFLGYAVAVLLIADGTGIGLMLLVSATALDSAVPHPVRPLFVFATFFIAMYLLMRLSLAFPGVAVDETYGLRRSWRDTKGRGFRLLGVIVATSVPITALIGTVFSVLVFYLFAELGGGTGQKGIPRARFEAFVEENTAILFIGLLIYMAFSYLFMALLVAAISIAFRTCTGWVHTAGGATAPQDEES